jgi:hypothetical protein
VQSISNGHILYQMFINIPTFSIPRHCKIFPNSDFWFENKPSGNPACVSSVFFFFFFKASAGCG